MRQKALEAAYCVALLAYLVAAPALAGSGDDTLRCERDRAADFLRSISDRYQPGDPSVVDDGILLVALGEGLSVGDQVRLEIQAEGERLSFEELYVRHDDLAEALGFDQAHQDSPAVVELLGGDPWLRAGLREQVAAGIDDLEVVVSVNGRLAAQRPLVSVLASSRALAETGPLPVAVERFERRTRRVPLAFSSSACEQDCDGQLDFCEDECVFVPNSGPCFASCNQQWEECRASCGGGCTPGSTSSSEDTLVSVVEVGPVYCAHVPIRNFFQDFIRVRERYRRVTTTVTTNADCSQTTSTTTSFHPSYCFRPHEPTCDADLAFVFFCPSAFGQ